MIYPSNAFSRQRARIVTKKTSYSLPSSKRKEIGDRSLPKGNG
jgi:hypothetical protein